MAAVAAIGQVGLHVADDAFCGVHGQAAEIVQRPGFVGLDGNARVGVGRAVMGLVAEQPRLGVPGTGHTGVGGEPGLVGRQVAQLVGRGRHYRRNGGRLAWLVRG